MNAEKFVKTWKQEKDNQLKSYLTENTTLVALEIKQLQLNDDQNKILKNILNNILTDTYYTLLLGLDGSASIGGLQQTYTIHDEDGNVIESIGDIEAEAYYHFIELEEKLNKYEERNL